MDPARPALSLPVGMRDMLPARAALRRRLARAVMGAFERRGYDHVVTPAFEREDVFALADGGRGRSELVRLLDPDTAEVLALRPDMTPQIARMVATRYRDAPMPVRLAYEGSVVRRPRGRSRRHRQIAQAGIECVGRAGVDADAEVIAAACEAISAAGARHAQVELAHAGVARSLLARVPDAVRDAVAEALSRRDRAVWQSLLADASPEVCRALDLASEAGGDPSLLDRVPAGLASVVDAAALDALRALRAALAEEGVTGVTVDLGELRGAGYYTGAFFQVLCEGAGEPVASGGRYDELLARYGFEAPATGCALELEVLEGVVGAASASEREGRVVVTGAPRARRAVAARLRAGGAVVAELDPCDAETAARWAEAHGYGRVVTCADEGAQPAAEP